MAVIWNPTVRKCVGILIPIRNAAYKRCCVVGFGVCPDTNDPKLVKISVAKIPSMWEVDVFTLSKRVWKTVYTGAPFKSCDLSWLQVFVDGVIYFRAYDDVSLDDGVRSNFVISFYLKSKKFGEVCLPERLVHLPYLDVTKILSFINDDGAILQVVEIKLQFPVELAGRLRRVGSVGKPPPLETTPPSGDRSRVRSSLPRGPLEAASLPSGRGKAVYISPPPLPRGRQDWIPLIFFYHICVEPIRHYGVFGIAY
nr:hypothetical protein [Tanacetum cinerariifolium]